TYISKGVSLFICSVGKGKKESKNGKRFQLYEKWKKFSRINKFVGKILQKISSYCKLKVKRLHTAKNIKEKRRMWYEEVFNGSFTVCAYTYSSSSR
ncbi:MAG TPA: hypothetical protein VIK63_06000, partial [Haloplasmataceae bacterium]